MDSSIRSLKTVPLHNSNQFPSILVAYSIHLKEDYKNAKKLLWNITYEHYTANVRQDFKMLGFLPGLHSGYMQ